MTLALLLTAVTGAWAEEPTVYNSTVAITDLKAGDILIEGAQVTLTSDNSYYLNFLQNRFFLNDATTPSISGFIHTTTTVTVGANGLMTGLSYDATARPATESGEEGNAWEVTAVEGENVKIVGITYDASASPVTVEWNASTKTGTFEMPGSDVVLTPIYANAATFATTGTGSEEKPLLPAAAEGVIAGTDASLIAEGTGIVANIGETTTAQGTLMYAVGTSATEAPALTAFSATAPTAKNVADDGATVYVWYYIKGADAPANVDATLDNTFDDTKPACLTVTVLTNKFDITLKAANANTIEAGRATVTVDGTDKTAAVTDGKLQGVKMGSEVKLEAKPGYKFRKVEVKKKEAGKPLANATTEDLGKVIGADGNIYANKDAAEAVATGNAVAMICYVNEGHGLALALSDISSYGNSWDNTGTYNEGKTAAELCSAWNTSKAVTGATWKLASLSEMKQMINAAGNYAALRDGFSAVGGTNMSDDYYWVSDESSADYAKNINFGGGHDSQEFKNDSYQVRACLEW